jgi:hypothetical protein
MREEEASADEFFADALRFFGETKLQAFNRRSERAASPSWSKRERRAPQDAPLRRSAMTSRGQPCCPSGCSSSISRSPASVSGAGNWL